MAQTANNAAVSPAATTETVLYTAPSGANDLFTVVNNLMICNGTANPVTFNVWRSIGGGAATVEDRIYFELSLPAKTTWEMTIGLQLLPGDELRVEASAANVAFNASVLEVDTE